MDSAATLLERYIFIVSILNTAGEDGLTISQIGMKWNGRFGDGAFVERTFHRQREAISKVFPVEIVCSGESGKPKYYLRQSGETSTTKKLAYATMNSFLLGNEISHDRLPMDRIYLCSSYCNRFTTLFAEAIRDSKIVRFHYVRSMQFFRKMSSQLPGKFSSEELVNKEMDYDFCPYALAFETYWFVIGVVQGEDKLMVFALDRIERAQLTENEFTPSRSFDYQKIRSSRFGGAYSAFPSAMGGNDVDDRMLYLTMVSNLDMINGL